MAHRAVQPCRVSLTITVWGHHRSALPHEAGQGEVGGGHRVRAQLLVGEPGHLRTTVSRSRSGKPVSSIRSSAVVEGSGCSSDTARIVNGSGATSESKGTLLLA